MDVLVGDRVVSLPQLSGGERVLAVHELGEVLVIPSADDKAASEAVNRAQEAFRALSSCNDEQISSFFNGFASALGDDGVWNLILEANRADVEDASARNRPTVRLAATEKMRRSMIEGLRIWAQAPSRRGEVVERRDGDTWTVQRRRAPLGVVAFVFEGRPNVFADGCGVVRSGNASVMRIGSDALRTAEAIDEAALAPSLARAGLPAGTVTIVRARSHGAGQALFTQPQVRLAVARGSGRAVALLGAIARQHGIPASLHGTGGAWMYADESASGDAVRLAIEASLDRKVCNTLNVLLVHPSMMKAASEALARTGAVVHRGENLGQEFEWDEVPELHVAECGSAQEAAELFNAHSPRFVVSILTGDPAVFERFYEAVDAPYVGNGFTRWVDGQWAWGRPELGLTNWEGGRVLGRSGILSGEDVFTVRDVFLDRTGRAEQRR